MGLRMFAEGRAKAKLLRATTRLIELDDWLGHCAFDVEPAEDPDHYMTLRVYSPGGGFAMVRRKPLSWLCGGYTGIATIVRAKAAMLMLSDERHR